jgi:multidrug resistance protein, MATE family
MALGTPFWAIGFTNSGALRGTGDTRWPMWINAGAFWLAVAFAAVLVPLLNGGLDVVWAAFIAMGPLSALLIVLRFRSVVARGDVKPVTEHVAD